MVRLERCVAGRNEGRIHGSIRVDVPQYRNVPQWPNDSIAKHERPGPVRRVGEQPSLVHFLGSQLCSVDEKRQDLWHAFRRSRHRGDANLWMHPRRRKSTAEAGAVRVYSAASTATTAICASRTTPAVASSPAVTPAVASPAVATTRAIPAGR